VVLERLRRAITVSSDERHDRHQARDEYEHTLRGLDAAMLDPAAIKTAQAQLLPRAGYTAVELADLHVRIATEWARAAVKTRLTQQGLVRQHDAIVDGLGVPPNAIADRDRETCVAMLVAQAEAGVLTTLRVNGLLLSGSEAVYAEAPARLLKEVSVREWQGGSRGISVPVGHIGHSSIRYRVGATRGHSAVVGTRTIPADSGTLYVTAARLLFKGMHTTVDAPFARLAGIDPYRDAIGIHLTTRQSVPLLAMDEHDVTIVLAVLGAAVERHREATDAPRRRPADTEASEVEDRIETLRKLGELRDAGVLTPDEFEAKKREILKRI
jgi:Short C-terminal domain